MSQNCDICCVNKKKFISCIYCKDKACNSCYETFLLDRPNDCCMFCNKEWNYEFIQTNFTKGFINGKYKIHKKNVIFEREKALFPDTQIEIEKIKRDEKIKDKIQEKKDLIDKLRKEMRELQISLFETPKEEEKEIRKFNVFCSVGECKGFLNNKFICGICETKHCKECRVALDEHKDDEHKCDPDTVATIKAIRDETRPCPKCSTPIFKIEGCDQMWCTSCHTTFSWKHGNIETGRVHNPHYWQYLQSQGRDLDAIRRLEENDRDICIHLQDASHRVRVSGRHHEGYIETCRLFTDIEFNVLHNIQCPDREDYHVESNLDIRIQFMLNKKDEKNFKKSLYAREKKIRYKQELRQIVQMYSDVGKEVLLNMYKLYRNNILNPDKIKEIFNEINELSKYTITQIDNLQERFGYKNTNGAAYTINLVIDAIKQYI